MTAIAQRVYRVVDVPDDAERVRYAGMQGVPVEAVSRRFEPHTASSPRRSSWRRKRSHGDPMGRRRESRGAVGGSNERTRVREQRLDGIRDAVEEFTYEFGTADRRP